MLGWKGFKSEYKGTDLAKKMVSFCQLLSRAYKNNDFGEENGIIIVTWGLILMK